MLRFRPMAYLTLAIVCVGFALVATAWGQDQPNAKPPPTSGQQVRLETTKGIFLVGKIPIETLRLEADFGTVDLKLAKIKAIDFSTEATGPLALVELVDKTHLSGKPLLPELVVTQTDGTVATVPFAELRELTILRPPVDLSLVAAILGLLTLTVMEIVLGIDNIIFLAILAGKLPPQQQPAARRIGLAAALVTRLGLLFSLSFLLGLTKPVFSLPIPGMLPDARDISWRDLILLGGGIFLIVKSVMEMHHKIGEAQEKEHAAKPPRRAGFAKVILQIAIVDIVFSLDSVITAVGMVDTLWVMVVAMVIAMLVMLLFAGPISRVVEQYPTIKVLALSFLILIGALLVAEGMGQHMDKGYVYFAMAFAVGIELVNLWLQPKGVARFVTDTE